MNIAAKNLFKNIFLPDQTLGLFVDGAHLAQITRQLQYEIDFNLLRSLFAGAGNLMGAYYYIGTKPAGQEDPAVRLLDWMELHGWRPVTKVARFYGDPGSEIVRTNFTVEMTVDMMRLSLLVDYSLDHLIVVTGNGDFSHLFKKLQDEGKRITLVSSRQTPKAMLSNELVKQADNFLDLADLKPLVARTR